MNNLTCDYETEVQKAALSGRFPVKLREHMADCVICQEVVCVADLMQDLAKSAEQPAELPNARYIWWKAQVLKNQMAEKRATRLVVAIRRFAYLAVAVGLAVLFLYQRAEVSNELRAFTESALSLPASDRASGAGFLVYLIPLLLGLNIVLTARTFWNNRTIRK